MRTLLLLALLTPAAYATTPPKEQSQDQDQTQHQEQGQSATSALVDQDRRQAPALVAPAIYASGTCSHGASGGISTPVGAITAGKSFTDLECDRRELARILTPLNPALALKLLCASPLLAGIATEQNCVVDGERHGGRLVTPAGVAESSAGDVGSNPTAVAPSTGKQSLQVEPTNSASVSSKVVDQRKQVEAKGK